MKRLLFAKIAFIGLVAATVPLPAIAQFKQEAKLVGTDAIGFSEQGYSAALSWDGNTALVGGRHDAPGMLNERGAAWVFERSRGKWTQQTKLVGMGDIGNADQGLSVSLSSSGNTAIVSGPFDNHNVGAAWIFQRSFNREWKQQAKLVPAGTPFGILSGYSASISGDGNTAVVGGFNDNNEANGGNGAGAAWVFERSHGVWSQQAKLVGTGFVGAPMQGYSVSISDDGNTSHTYLKFSDHSV